MKSFKEIIEENENFPSRYSIGEQVNINIQGVTIYGYVRTVTFTSGKVRYSVKIPINKDSDIFTTMHNLDSVLLSDGDGTSLDLGFDNYS